MAATLARAVTLRAAALAACLAVLAGCDGGFGPFAKIPEIAPDELDSWLGSAPRPLVVDLRAREHYEAGHLPGALSLTLDGLDAYLSRAPIERDHPVIVVCNVGHLSKLGASTAIKRGFRHAYSLAGGMEAVSPRRELEKGAGPPIAPELLKLPVRELNTFEQLVTATGGIGIKTLYSLLSLALVFVLWNARDRGLTLVRHSMVLFFFGEGMCALNIAFANGQNDSLELWHGLGMAGMGMFLPWGLSRLLDERVLRYEDPKHACAMQRFCGRCWKREEVSCGLQRLFLFAAPALALVWLMPLTAPLAPARFVLPVFGTDVVWQFSLPMELMEFRLYPVLAAVSSFIAFLLVLGGKRTFRLSQPFFFAGFGLGGFALMRFFLFRSYRDLPVWGDAWEELTEFLAIATVAVGLWVFRDQLGVLQFGRKPAPPQPAPE